MVADNGCQLIKCLFSKQVNYVVFKKQQNQTKEHWHTFLFINNYFKNLWFLIVLKFLLGWRIIKINSKSTQNDIKTFQFQVKSTYLELYQIKITDITHAGVTQMYRHTFISNRYDWSYLHLHKSSNSILLLWYIWYNKVTAVLLTLTSY